MPDASSFWQKVFLGASAIYLFFAAWQGWRRGVVRSGISLFALIASFFLGMLLGGAVSAIVGRFVPLPGAVIVLATALIVAIPIYAGIRLLGALVFKKTNHQRSLPIRLLYGMGGAVFGLIIGYFVWWSVVSFLRASGSLSEGKIRAAQRGRSLSPVTGFDRFSAMLKRSIESGRPGRIVERADLISPDIYRVLGKTGEVISSPRAFQRLFEYSGIQALMSVPSIVALTSDPEFQAAARSGNWPAALKNPGFLAVANDPVLLRKLEAIHVEAALDFALETPGPQEKQRRTP